MIFFSFSNKIIHPDNEKYLKKYLKYFLMHLYLNIFLHLKLFAIGFESISSNLYLNAFQCIYPHVCLLQGL